MRWRRRSRSRARARASDSDPLPESVRFFKCGSAAWYSQQLRDASRDMSGGGRSAAEGDSTFGAAPLLRHAASRIELAFCCRTYDSTRHAAGPMLCASRLVGITWARALDMSLQSSTLGSILASASTWWLSPLLLWRSVAGCRLLLTPPSSQSPLHCDGVAKMVSMARTLYIWMYGSTGV